MILLTAEGRIELALEPPRAEYRYDKTLGDVVEMKTLLGYREGTLTLTIKEVRGLSASLTFSHDKRYRITVQLEPVEGPLYDR